MIKIVTEEYSRVGERIIGDYTEAFLKDVRRWSPEGIDGIRELEAISNFRAVYSKRKNLNDAQIIQGINEISHAAKVYNAVESE